MKIFHGLNHFEIYTIPVGDYFGHHAESFHLVYAPHSNNALIAGQEELEAMERYASGDIDHHSVSGSIIEAVEDLKDNDCYKAYQSIPYTINNLTKLSILPTYNCNFSCSYCYSSKGRSTKNLDIKKAYSAIDFFIDKNRLDERRIYMAILGGGEPFITWDSVAACIEYASQRAIQQGFKLSIGVTTNGSIINPEIIDILKRYHVITSISFEILERIQNKQRRNYNEVCRVIDSLCIAGIELSIKSIITPDNVMLLEEMTEELATKFPQIKSLKLQPVESNTIFTDAKSLENFYTLFSENFFKAREKAIQHGIELYCPVSKNTDYLLDHYCGGELCLTPEGSISICHRISSPLEPDYNNFNYGIIDGQHKIHFNTAQFNELMAHNSLKLDRCKNCFAKWHCGGGCLAQAKTYTPDMLKVICDWTVLFIRQIILLRLEDQYKAQGLPGLKATIDNDLS